MPNSRFCLGVLVPSVAATVGAGPLVGAGGTVASGALVAGAAVAPAGAVAPTAAVGSAGVGAVAISGLPPHEARIGNAITSIMSAALIRICANRIFTINLLIECNLSICSIASLYTRLREC